ncbi:MAG: hypothetical protein II791_07085 [Bacteroidales bacterium]|nr:hypothetical protein [Bacteroidales bacterium]
MRQKHTTLLIALALLTSCHVYGPDRQTEALLQELDGYVSSREVYVARKKSQMETLSKLARQVSAPERRFDLEMRIAQEYFAFSFDSTQAYLKHCQNIAKDVLRDKDRYNEASILLGHLYAKAGSYMEAQNLLYNRIDTLSLSDTRKIDYLLTLYDFSRDLSGNSGMVEKLSIMDMESLRARLLPLLPKDSENWRVLTMHGFSGRGEYQKADSICRRIISNFTPENHPYAVYAYELSTIAEAQGKPDEQMQWLVKSAESDIINAVKDYASLAVVAQRILPVDVERSFRYLQIAQEDAIFYNAKLRPWQISRFMMRVEGAYSDRQARSSKMLQVMLILLAVLSAGLIVISRFLSVRSRKLTKAKAELENSNARLASANITLNDLNRQISRADAVKEEYIVQFLEGLSSQISTIRTEDNRFRNLLKQGKADQLLKELSISGRSEKARESFYQTFDSTFLGLYPDFVEQFNALLKEDARIHPPKGRLTTELRIFALIRLGVDDSKEIARILDYSVSTIYNNKVSVKNAALEDRDGFEERVKMIGK